MAAKLSGMSVKGTTSSPGARAGKAHSGRVRTPRTAIPVPRMSRRVSSFIICPSPRIRRQSYHDAAVRGHSTGYRTSIQDGVDRLDLEPLRRLHHRNLESALSIEVDGAEVHRLGCLNPFEDRS